MFRLLFIVIIIGGIIAFIAKVATKRRMSKALGREVKDHEITSLNSWMAVTENEERNRQPRP